MLPVLDMEVVCECGNEWEVRARWAKIDDFDYDLEVIEGSMKCECGGEGEVL